MARKEQKRAPDKEPKKLSISSDDLEEAQADENYAKMMRRLHDNIWGHSKKGLLAVKANMQMLSLKTGIYSRVPIFCKGEECPYAPSCITYAEGMAPEGQACPAEVAMITQKLAAYTEEFGLDKEGASITDASLVEEIILMEISMKRCEALMAQEGNPIQNMVIGISDSGEPVYQPQVSKAIEAYERFQKKRNTDYDLLLATRKSRQKEDKADPNDENIMTILDQAEETDGFYDIEKRPEDVEFEESKGK